MPRGIVVTDVYWWREALGLSQTECARACGLTLSTYQGLETGRHDPTLPTLRKLAKGLHVSQKTLRGEAQP
jgi:transcriptional regulator with XRE-family HTH domain